MASERHATGAHVMTYALPGVPVNLDIQPYDGDPTSQTVNAFDSTLFHYVTENLPSKGCNTIAPLSSIQPDLAKSYKFSHHRRTITITLKHEVSNYGHQLTAEDVKWSLDRLMAISPPGDAVLTQFVSYNKQNIATVVSRHVVRLHLLKSSPIDIAVLTHPLATIFDATEAKKHATSSDPWANKWMQTHMAVFGPWKVASYSPGNQLTLSPNPYFHGKRGNITKVIFKGVPASSSRAQLVASGAADFAVDLSYSDFKSLEGKPGVKTLDCSGPKADTLILNMKKPPFDKLAVRKAVSMAINRTALDKGAYLGLALAATSGVSRAYPFVHPKLTYTYDPAKAKQLLAAAGYPNGFSFTLTYSPTKGAQQPESAILIQSMLKQVGITVTLQEVADASQFQQGYFQSQYQGILFQEPPAVAFPYYSKLAYNASYSQQNSYGYKNATWNKVLQELRRAHSPKQQARVVNRLADLSVKTMPEVYLADAPNLYAFRTSIHGFTPVPYDKFFPAELKKR